MPIIILNLSSALVKLQLGKAAAAALSAISTSLSSESGMRGINLPCGRLIVVDIGLPNRFNELAVDIIANFLHRF